MEKTFDAATAEQRIYTAWEQAGAFKAGANARRDDTYSIMIPPPNVTGVLHMGHAFNNTLQDILIRWKRMQGYDTLWQPGTDHAGIATQMVVERQLNERGQKRTDFTREEFLAKVWEWKEQSGGTIINQLKRLGASCDWEREAFTMSGNFPDAVIKVFVEMYNKGLIYRGKRLVNWDPHFETAISDLEVENVEIDGHMWHFKYPLAGGESYEYVEKDEDGNVVLREVRDYISIATTRPETMLGDGAVAVHPSDERYAPIVGKLCEIPVGPKEYRRLIPIITDDYPDPDFGSGAVKITGAHDFNDYGVAKRGNIPMYALMDTKGRMRDDGRDYAVEAGEAQSIAAGELAWDENSIAAMNLVPDEYRGLDRFEARKKVVADIDADGLMIKIEDKKIMQPFGDRSKVVIEPMLTDQWFVDTAKIVGPALDAVRDGTVKILPESGEKTYYHWLENIEPWCISRQLWWGHQVPVWYGPRYTSDQLPSISEFATRTQKPEDKTKLKEILNKASEKIAFCGASFDDILEQARIHYGENIEIVESSDCYASIRKQAGQSLRVELIRDPDVLDTWFSSGLWPIGTLGWPEDTEELKKYFPTSDLITGQDILFFWVARMMMMQLAVVGDIPFKNVYLHGLVRDAKGKKMSKSTGNVVDPLDIIDEFGADALRFTNAAMASLGGVLKLDTQRIAGYRNFGTKLWNACRFAEMNQVFEHRGTGIPKPQKALNQWIIGETARVLADVNAALTAYRFNDAAQALYAFVWGKVCDWYVELSKPLLQAEDQETRETMAWVLDQSLIMLHPIMPFITEELWGQTGDRSKMLIHADWPEYGDLTNADADAEINWVITLIENIRSARAQLHVPAGAKIPMLELTADQAAKAALAGNLDMIKRLARVESVEMADALPKGAVAIHAPGASFGLPVADVIDIAAEKARLEKTLGKLEKELGGLRGRLNNPKFVDSAPDAVVEETRAALAEKEEELTALKAALGRLAELG